MLMTEVKFRAMIGEEQGALLDELVQLEAVVPLNPGLGNYYSTKHKVLLERVQAVMTEQDMTVQEVVPFITIDGSRVERLDREALDSFLNGEQNESPVTEPIVVEEVLVIEPVVEENTPATEPVVEENTPATEPVVEENTPATEPVVEENAPATEPVVEENAPATEPVVEENAPATEETTTNEGLPVLTEEEILALTYTQLVQLASDNRQYLPNFRRMKKADLLIAFSGNTEAIAEMIERVRIDTRNRYGSGSRNMETGNIIESDTTDLVTAVDANLSELEGTATPQEQLNLFAEENVVEENVEGVTASNDNDSNEEVVEGATRTRNRGRAVQDAIRLDFAMLATISLDDTVEFNYEPYIGTRPEGVNLTLEDIMSKTAKQIAVIVRQARPRVRYFRRMTRDELLYVLFSQDENVVMEMMLRAFVRYQRY